MTVEEFLRSQMEAKKAHLKRHAESLIESFDAQAKKVKADLNGLAQESMRRASVAETSARKSAETEGAPSSSTTTDAAAAAPAADVDAFALVCIRGLFSGKVFRVSPNDGKVKWTIGRSDDNDLSLEGDDEVSSSHAQITFDKKKFKLTDKGSTNGTFTTTSLASAVKLKKNKGHELKIDHLITFGSCTFKWCYHADAVALGAQLGPAKRK